MSEEYNTLKERFEGIRDERGLQRNTASRIGRAFLDLLDYMKSNVEGKFISKVNNDTAQGLITFAAGLVSNALAWFKQGIKIGSSADSTLGIDANGNATLNNITAAELIASIFNTPGFIEAVGLAGKGFGVKTAQDGRAMLQTDDLLVLGRMIVNSLNVREVTYIGGIYLLTPAGSTVAAVQQIFAEEGNESFTNTWNINSELFINPVVVGYRLYWLADNGTTSTMNFWKQGDQAYSQTFNIEAGVHENVSNSLWWRLVVGVGTDDNPLGDGKEYHYADVADVDVVLLYDEYGDEILNPTGAASFIGKGNSYAYVSNGLNSYTVPVTGDKAVCIGSQTDSNRRGAIQLNTEGEASIGIYDGINNYNNLSTHEVHFLSKSQVRMSSRKFMWTTATGESMPPTIYRGDWTQGSTSYYYDEWDYQGSRWLCIFAGDSDRPEGLTCAPGTKPTFTTGQTEHDADYYWKQISLKGDDGTGYKLLPSVDVIKTTKTGTNTFDPPTASLTCGYTKNVGSTITSVADATSLIDNTYCVYFRRKSRGGNYESKYWFYTDSKARAFLSSMSLSNFDAVEFYIANDSKAQSLDIATRATFLESLENIIDHVVVPVIADGLDGENATSPIIADLDNQMTSVACDKSGNVEGSSDKSLTTTVRMYKGSTLQTGGFTSITCKINGTTLGDDYVNENTPRKYYKVSLDTENNALTGGVTITVKSGTNIDGKTEVDITAVMTIDGTAVTRTVTFTISGVRAGADGTAATLYELLPSKDAISFGSGTTSQSIYMELLKIEGDSAETLAMNYIQNSGLYVLYGTTNVPDEDDAKKLIDDIGNVNHSDVKKWGTANGATGLSFSGENNNTATILSTATFTQIYLALFRKVTADGTTSYVLLDRETVPIVKDGADGKDGVDGQDGHDGQDGTDGNDGVDGADAVLVKLDPENIIITQSTEEVSGSYPLLKVGTITYNGSSTYVLGSATVKVVEGGVEKSNFSINSVSSDTCTAVKADDGKTIGITNVGTSGGEYLTSGYVTVSVTYGSKSYSVRLNFYCNLLGTWKTSIENGIESDISRHIGYYIDPSGNVVTTQQLGEFIRGWSENTAKLTETIGSRYNGNNLFGFSKGVGFGNAIPFVQGYGFVSNLGSAEQMGLGNLGFNGETGYYVVTCEAKMLGTNGARNVTFAMWFASGEMFQTRNITTSWTKLTMVFKADSFPPNNDAKVGYFYTNGVFENSAWSNPLTDNNRLAIRKLQIERGSVPSAFGICAEDAANASEAMPLSITAKSEMPLNSGSSSGNLEGQPFYGQDISWNDDDANWVSYTSGGQNHYYIDLLSNSTSVNLESGKIYTLSFWARASINGMSIRSFLYPNIITAQGNATYIDGDSSKGIYDDGMTELYLTTSWRKYYVHWYVASGGNKNLIIARLCDQIISGTNSDNLYGYIYLCGIRFDKGYVTSANRTVYSTVMKQTARTIDFSVMVNTQEKAGIHLLTETGGTPENENEVAKGIIELNADTTRISNDLVVHRLLTEEKANKPHVEIYESKALFYGGQSHPNIVLAVDKNGCAQLNFYDKDNNFMYGLGPSTIFDKMGVAEDSWSRLFNMAVFSDYSNPWSAARVNSLANATTSEYYQFIEGYKYINNAKKYNQSQGPDPSQYNEKVLSQQTLSSSYYIAPGYYVGDAIPTPSVVDLERGEQLYFRTVYSVSAAGAVPTFIGTYYYRVTNGLTITAKLADSQGNLLNCSSSYNMSYYIQSGQQ